MEIRTLRAGEHEALLSLLEGWELPDGWRGRDFFHRYLVDDPTFRDENVFVAEDAGRFLSCLQIFPRRLRVGRAVVAVGGIGSVYTAPAARSSGVASAVLERAADAMRERGMMLSLLFASRLAFYSRLGWNSWPSTRTLLRRSAGAPGPGVVQAVDAPEIRTFESAHDFAAVERLHARYTGKRPGTVVRDAATWTAALRNGGNPREDFLVATSGDETVAYARAMVLSGFLMLSELGREEGAEAALAALVDRILTPRVADPLERPDRPSAALRSLGVAPPLHDEPLAKALAARGVTVDAYPDPGAMFRCLDAEALAHATGTRLEAGEDGTALLRRVLPPERFSYWLADRF